MTRCDFCRRQETPRLIELRRCTQCFAAVYCSRDCQKRDWKVRHKVTCRAPPPSHPAACRCIDHQHRHRGSSVADGRLASQLEGGPLSECKHESACAWRAIPEISPHVRSRGEWLTEAHRVIDALALPVCGGGGSGDGGDDIGTEPGFFVEIPLPCSQEDADRVVSRTWTPVSRDDYRRTADPTVHGNLRALLRHVVVSKERGVQETRAYDHSLGRAAAAAAATLEYVGFRGLVELSDAGVRSADARITCDQYGWESWCGRSCRLDTEIDVAKRKEETDAHAYADDRGKGDGGGYGSGHGPEFEVRARSRSARKQRRGAPPADERRARYVLSGPSQNTQGDPASEVANEAAQRVWQTCVFNLLDFRPDFPREWGRTLAFLRRRLERDTTLAEPCVLAVLAYLPMWIAYHHAELGDAHAIPPAVGSATGSRGGSGSGSGWRFPALTYARASASGDTCSASADEDLALREPNENVDSSGGDGDEDAGELGRA